MGHRLSWPSRRRPGLVLGHEPLGVVEQVGSAVGFGRTHDRRYTVLLSDLVLSGRARPRAVVTHHGRLDDAPGLYRAFDQRTEGVSQAVLRP